MTRNPVSSPPVSVPVRRYDVFLGGTVEARPSAKGAVETRPSHSVTVQRVASGDTTGDRLMIDSRLLERDHWQWLPNRLGIQWHQGEGTELLSGLLLFTDGHDSGHGNFASGEAPARLATYAAAPIKYLCSVASATANGDPSQPLASFNPDDQTFSVDNTSAAWNNPEYWVAGALQWDYRSAQRIGPTGGHIKYTAVQFEDTRVPVDWPAAGSELEYQVTFTLSPRFDTLVTFDYSGILPPKDAYPAGKEPTGEVPDVFPYLMSLTLLPDMSALTGAMLLVNPATVSGQGAQTANVVAIKGSLVTSGEDASRRDDDFSAASPSTCSTTAPTLPSGAMTASPLLNASAAVDLNALGQTTTNDFYNLINWAIYQTEHDPSITTAKQCKEAGSAGNPNARLWPLLHPSDPCVIKPPTIDPTVLGFGEGDESWLYSLGDAYAAYLLGCNAPNIKSDCINYINADRASTVLTRWVAQQDTYRSLSQQLFDYRYSNNDQSGETIQQYLADQQANGTSTAYRSYIAALCQQWKQYIICETAQSTNIDPSKFSSALNCSASPPPSLTGNTQLSPADVLANRLYAIDQLGCFANDNGSFYAFTSYYWLVNNTMPALLPVINSASPGVVQLISQMIQNWSSVLSVLDSSNTFAKAFYGYLTSILSTQLLNQLVDYKRFGPEINVGAIEIFKTFLEHAATYGSPDVVAAVQEVQAYLEHNGAEDMLNLALNELFTTADGAVGGVLWGSIIETTAGRIADSSMKLIVRGMGLAAAGFALVSFISGGLSFSQLNKQTKAQFIAGAADFTFSAMGRVVSAGASTIAALDYASTTASDELGFWKLFTPNIPFTKIGDEATLIRKSILDNFSNGIMRWLGNADVSDDFKAIDQSEVSLLDAYTFEDGDLPDIFSFDPDLDIGFLEGVNVDTSKSWALKVFGDNLDDFVTTRVGFVFSVAGAALSTWGLIDVIENHGPAITIAADSLMLASGVLDTISTGIGLVTSAASLDIGVLADIGSIAGLAGIAFAVAGGIIMIILFIEGVKSPPDPVKTFANYLQSHTTPFDLYMPQEVAIDYFQYMPSTVQAAAAKAAGTSVGNSPAGVSLSTGSQYLTLSSSGASLGDLTHGFETVFGLTADSNGSAKILTEDPETQQALLLYADQDGNLKTVLSSDFAKTLQSDASDQDYLYWVATAISGDASDRSSATFTFYNKKLGTSYYLSSSGSQVELSSTATEWTVARTILAPGGLSYGIDDVVAIGGANDTFSPHLSQQGGAPLTWTISRSPSSPSSDSLPTHVTFDSQNKGAIVYDSSDPVPSDMKLWIGTVTVSNSVDPDGTSATVYIQNALSDASPRAYYACPNRNQIVVGKKGDTFSPTITQPTNPGDDPMTWSLTSPHEIGFLQIDANTGVLTVSGDVPVSYLGGDNVTVVAQNDYGRTLIETAVDLAMPRAYYSSSNVYDTIEVSKQGDSFSPSILEPPPSESGSQYTLGWTMQSPASIDFLEIDATSGVITVASAVPGAYKGGDSVSVTATNSFGATTITVTVNLAAGS